MHYRYLLYLLALIPAFVFRDFTPDNELKYISIVDEALSNNTWFTFYNHGEIYADKPPLYFWLMMLSRLIAGDYYMWLMGLFSLLPAIGVMMVMDRWIKLEKLKNNPLLSNMMLITTAIFLGGALVLRMDMLMTLFIVLSMYTFFRIYKGAGTPADRWMLPVWIFLALFSKGPMGILIPLVSVVAFLAIRKQLRSIGKYFGWKQLGILVGLCALWFSLVYLEGGKQYLNNILFKQTVGRGIDSFHHKEHLFWYLPRMFYTFAPWSLLYLVCIWRGVRRKLIISDTEKFFYTTVWVNIVMLSLISSKIDIYMLPIYPFIVYLSSALLSRGGSSLTIKVCLGIPAVVFALLLPASFFAKGAIPFDPGDLGLVRLALAVASLGGIFALISIYRNMAGRAIRSLATGMLAMVFIASFSIPQFNREIGFRAMAHEAGDYAAENGIESYSFWKYRAFSDMDVFLGKQLKSVGTIHELDSLESAVPTVIFLRERDIQRNEELKKRIETYPQVGHTSGYRWVVASQSDTIDMEAGAETSETNAAAGTETER